MESPNHPSGDEALRRLTEGNRRFVAGYSTYASEMSSRRVKFAKEQQPWAAVVGCSDSRVPPEIVFDQRLGDLFVVRVAGNVPGGAAMASVEFAVDRLRVPLIVVLGHTRCGAVELALKGEATPGRMGRMAEALRPAVEQAKSLGGDLWDNAVRENVRRIVGLLSEYEPFLKPQIDRGALRVVGAIYDLDTGAVEIVPQ
jgi:carbonic anhydrase